MADINVTLGENNINPTINSGLVNVNVESGQVISAQVGSNTISTNISSNIISANMSGFDNAAYYMQKAVYDSDGDGQVDKADEADSVDWNNVQNKPSEFTSESHNHTESDISDLDKYTQSEVDGFLSSKANSTHSHTASEVTDFDTEVVNNTDVAANISARHSHSNKSILDNIQEAFTTALKSAYDTVVGYVDQSVKTDASPTFNQVTTSGQVIANGVLKSNAGGQQSFKASNDFYAPNVAGYKSRGTVENPTAVNAYDEVFSLEGYAYLGSTSEYVNCARIILQTNEAPVDGSPSIGTQFTLRLSKDKDTPNSGVLYITPTSFAINNNYTGSGLHFKNTTNKMAATMMLASGQTAHAFVLWDSSWNTLFKIDKDGNTTVNALKLADSKKAYFGTSDDAGIWYDGSNLHIDAQLVGSGNIILDNIPTSDPSVAGAIYNDSGTLKISAG